MADEAKLPHDHPYWAADGLMVDLDYLSMMVDFSTQGSVAFDMIPYINEIMAAFPEQIMEVTSSPAADHLFQV